MQTQLNNILQAAKEQLASAATLAEVNDVRVKYMGKKGEVTQILKGMGKLPPEEKKELGQAANKVRNEIEELVNASKIIRPAYQNVMPRRDYVPMGER